MKKHINVLKLDNLNLLENPNNCIESSTAIGFCFEEWITSKLISSNSKIKFERIQESTQRSSYDLFANYKNEKYLINIKTEKFRGSKNNAISATTQLYNDYVKDPEVTKHFMLVKFRYEIVRTKEYPGLIELLINENNPFIYFLEEVRILTTTPADKRSWSDSNDQNAGRIQISECYLRGKLINLSKNTDEKINSRREISEISYENTKNDIETRYWSLKKTN